MVATCNRRWSVRSAYEHELRPTRVRTGLRLELAIFLNEAAEDCVWALERPVRFRLELGDIGLGRGIAAGRHVAGMRLLGCPREPGCKDGYTVLNPLMFAGSTG